MPVRIVLVPVLLLPALLGGCAAVSVASVIASTTASTAVRAIDAEMQENAAAAPHLEEVADANLRVAVEYLRLGNYEGALARLDRAREAAPRNAYIYSVYGLVHQSLGQTQEAEENFRRSMELDRTNPQILNNYGQFLCGQDRGGEAEKLFLQAAKDPLYQTPDLALTNAGLCAQRNGDVARATEYFNKALVLNPRAPATLLALGEVQYNNENYEDAQKLFQRYLKVAPQTPRSLWLGIRIADKVGDKDAKASYTMLLKNKYPDSAEAGYLKDPVS